MLLHQHLLVLVLVLATQREEHLPGKKQEQGELLSSWEQEKEQLLKRTPREACTWTAAGMIAQRSKPLQGHGKPAEVFLPEGELVL